jgi:chemotaxis protein CheD
LSWCIRPYTEKITVESPAANNTGHGIFMDNETVPENIYLKPGEIYCSHKPAVISTLLGSCVSVTMFSQRAGAGSICHGLLPSCKGQKPCESDKFCREGMRYVDCSIIRMLGWFERNGVTRGEIDVKVFGGSDMLSGLESATKTTVGKQNISMAFQVIEKENLRIAASDVGGLRGRKIIFSTHTGEVLLKRLLKSETEKL